MAGYSFWVFNDDKLPRVYKTPARKPTGKTANQGNGAKYVFVESNFTDKRLGLNKRKGNKRK